MNEWLQAMQVANMQYTLHHGRSLERFSPYWSWAVNREVYFWTEFDLCKRFTTQQCPHTDETCPLIHSLIPWEELGCEFMRVAKDEPSEFLLSLIKHKPRASSQRLYKAIVRLYRSLGKPLPKN